MPDSRRILPSRGAPTCVRTHPPLPAVTLALLLALVPAPPAAAATPAADVTADLTGEWVLNAAASQTLSLPGSSARPASPAAGTAGGAPAAEDPLLPDPPARPDDGSTRPPPPRRPPAPWLTRPERLEALRTLLSEVRSLSIVQTPTYVDLRTELSSRSLEVGADSQVSLPTGELADQRVRWQGRRLVIERRVPRGVKIVETYQRLPATDQLEVTVRRSGGPDDGLGKLELRRVFDRERDDAPVLPSSSPVSPTANPVRSTANEASR